MANGTPDGIPNLFTQDPMASLGNQTRGIQASSQQYADANKPDAGAYQWLGTNDAGQHELERYAHLAAAARAIPYQGGMQQYGIDRSREAMLGQGPSVGQIQMLQGLHNAQMQAAATAGSARGGGANLALAQRAGMLQGGAMGLQGNQQAAAVRAQEIAQAQAAYGQQVAGLRNADIQQVGQAGALASQYEGMRQQQGSNMTNLGLAYQHALQNKYLTERGIQAGVSVGNAQANSQLTGALIGGAGAGLAQAAQAFKKGG